jgi:protein phosphatase 2C family protein 2/3
LIFGNEDGDDDEDDDSDEEVTGGRSFFSETLGLGRPESPDPTKKLRAQLEESEKGEEGHKLDVNGDEEMLDDDSPTAELKPIASECSDH